uniref:WAP domain-containing protein n=1 Tax=Bursaphelenchus xylophilus TaxID=6326 RepID=A0A1I7RTA1_BURXY
MLSRRQKSFDISASPAKRELCVDVVGSPCCVQPRGVCPTTQQLDIKCVKHRSTNWCNSNRDCAKDSLCCDTGCGYNMCVSNEFRLT